VEPKRACNEGRKKLAAKLKDSSLIELELDSKAKLKNEPTVELKGACNEARNEFALKLEDSS